MRNRRLWLMAVFLGGLALLGACGTGGDSTETDEPDETSVPATCQGGGVVIVFVNPAVSPARAADIGAALQALPSVESIVYVDQQQAYAEFQTIYKDQPELLATVTPEVLPSSYRLTLGPDGDRAAIEAAATGLDGVGQVIC